MRRRGRDVGGCAVPGVLLMGLALLTAEDVPLSLADLKQKLRIATTDGETAITDDDSELIAILQAACDDAERYTGRAFRRCSYQLTLDAFPADGGAIVLPRPPLQSVTSIEYVDSTGTTQTVSSPIVDATSVPGRVTPAYGSSWPATRDQLNAVTVTFVCGYEIGDVPPKVIQALKLFAEREYDELDGSKADRLERRVRDLLAGLRIRDARLTGIAD